MSKVLKLGLLLLASLGTAKGMPNKNPCSSLQLTDFAPGQTRRVPATLNCGTVSIKTSASQTVITSTRSLNDAWQVLDQSGQGVILDAAQWYDYPDQKLGFHSSDVRLALKNGVFVSSATPDVNLRTIGIKIKDGPLQPIFYRSKFYKVEVPQDTKIDIYIKPYSSTSATILFQHLSIDPVTKTIIINKHSAFPSS